VEVIWLIAYDITDQRRREAVSSILSACGARVQLSVFECVVHDPPAVTLFVKRLTDEIDPTEDQIRIYPIDTEADRRTRTIGARTLEERRDFHII
jgi:CRISPR-associated protein Cas2